MVNLAVFACTGIGKVRTNNEDNFLCNGVYKKTVSEEYMAYCETIDGTKEFTGAVCDGMGGNSYGEEAALIAVSALNDYVSGINGTEQRFNALNAVKLMNDKICQWIEKHNISIGTTAVIIHYEISFVQICNIGDSKAYLYRKGEILQLTQDHNEKSALLKLQHELGLEEIDIGNASENVLTQYLGVKEDEFILEPALTDKIEVEKGDIFLLCSDGLSGMLSESEIVSRLSEDKILSDKGYDLYNAALNAGGRDNITMLLLEAT